MRAAAIVAALMLGWMPVVPADEPPEPKPPRDWSWLTPGKTTREAIEARAGKPTHTWESVVKIGEIDLAPFDTEPGYGIELPRQVTDPKTQIAVEVLSYVDDPSAASRQFLVLFRQRLVYSILPPASGEKTVTELQGRYLKEGRVYRTEFGHGCIVRTHLVVEHADDGVAFVAPFSAGACAGEVTQRVRWCAARDFAPDFATEWRIPKVEDRPADGGN